MSSLTPLRPRSSNDGWQPTSTTPLRIAKRDSPQPEQTTRVSMARRNSTSWRHVLEGSRVSKSPFKLAGKSGIPTPARPSTGHGSVAQARRVSGEKRPRTMSMNEQGENEHPAQRKRRQSQGLQGLVNRKPVTKSPFRAPSTEVRDEENSVPLQPQPQIQVHHQPHQLPQEDDMEDFNPPPPPPKEQLFVPGRQSPHRTSPSPARPSLVSRRLHGPRTSLNRRQRRKTVTFDETCDVMEYDVEEDSGSAPFEWVTDEDNDPDDEDDNDTENAKHHETPVQTQPHHDHDETHSDDEPRGPLRVNNGDESFESLQLGEDSITGLVNSMLQDARPRTPPQDKTLPEDGVPLGRTHHAERAAAAHNYQNPEHAVEESLFPIHNTSLSTPTHSREGTPLGSVSPGSHIPLGRTTHAERIKAHKEVEHERRDMDDDDVSMLPPSPSPAKRHGPMHTRPMSESALPRFSLVVPKDFGSPSNSFDPEDPFARPSSTQSIRRPDSSFELSHRRAATDDAGNTSLAHSDVSLSGMDFEVDFKGGEAQSSTEEGSVMPNMSTPPTSPPRHGFVTSHDNFSKDSLLARLSTPTKDGALHSFRESLRSGSPSFNISPGGSPSVARGSTSRSGSPFLRGESPIHHGLPRIGSFGDMSSPSGSPGGSGRSPRITRENVQRILEKKRSIDSPLRDKTDPAFDFSVPRRSLETAPASPAEDSKPKRPAPSRVPPPKMTRDNPTFDGVLSIDPTPQPNDPPRPTLPARASSFDGAAETGDSRAEPGNASTSFTHLGDMKSALDRLMADVAGEARMTPDGKGVVGLRVEAVTEGVKAGRHSLPDNEDGDVSMADASTSKADAMDIDDEPKPATERMEFPMHIDLPPHDHDPLLHTGFMSPEVTGNPPPVRPTSPQPPAKEAIRAREELIKAKKREARRREESEDDYDEYLAPPRRPTAGGRPGRRRSMSTGDAEDLLENRSVAAKRRVDALKDGGLLDNVPIDEEDPLADSIDRELRRLKGGRSKYHVRERSETIYATSDADRLACMSAAGDVEDGRAWRTVKRPSDMNEYSKQLKELRAQEGNAKAYGKVFVKVVGVKGLNVPLPSQPTAITCTLNNGIHFVTTPETALGTESRIDQEFELIEHSKLEFTLTIKVRRDPHIITQFKAHTPPPLPPPVIAPPPASKGGMRSFFSSKKAKHVSAPTPMVARPPPQIPENLARYLKPDGTLARAFIAFKDIAKRCDTKLFETSYPLIGQRLESTGTKTMQVGELVLQIFRLPPLPGIPQDQLPQSLEDCHRGLRHVAWHKVTYFEGTLTQNGGDCTSWRRRHLRVVGSNLVAFNDVTKKAIATIDLKKALSVEDDEEARRELFSPASAVSARSSRYIEFDGPYGVERSFRLLFPHNQSITFFADTDEEKARWLEVLRALVGHIPPNPLWAEVLWQRQQETAKQPRVTSPQAVRSPQPRPAGPSRIPEPQASPH